MVISGISSIALKIASNKLSSKQKQALAKAIKASALKRARRSKVKEVGLARAQAKLTKSVAKKTVKINAKLASNTQKISLLSNRTADSRLQVAQARDKLLNPSFTSKALGLHNVKKKEKLLVAVERVHARANAELQRTSRSSMILQNKLNKLAKAETKLQGRITRNAQKGVQAQLQAEKYAKLSGTTITSNDLSLKQGYADLSEKAFWNTFIGLSVAQTGVGVYAASRQNKRNKDKK
jgi:hypothetical protein